MNERQQRRFKFRNRRNGSHRGRNSLLGTIITAIAGAAVKDLTSENSKLKILARRVFLPRKTADKLERKTVEAEFEVIENKQEAQKESKEK